MKTWEGHGLSLQPRGDILPLHPRTALEKTAEPPLPAAQLAGFISFGNPEQVSMCRCRPHCKAGSFSRAEKES